MFDSAAYRTRVATTQFLGKAVWTEFEAASGFGFFKGEMEVCLEGIAFDAADSRIAGLKQYL
jgi:hypothetical protein